MKLETAEFPNGNQARVLRVARGAAIEDVVDALELPPSRGVVIVNGGTAKMDRVLEAQLARVLQDGLARFAAEEQLTVITGGTDAGIFHLLGEGFGRFGPPAACIGVAVAGLVRWTDGSGPREPESDWVALEPHHSHFVLVEGRDWGDETETMYRLVDRLTRDCPSVALFASGGGIAVREMKANVDQQRTMILLAGCGRLTDQVLAVREGGDTEDERVREIAGYDKIISYDIGKSPAGLAKVLRQRLWG